MFKHLLVPIDGSEFSDQSIDTSLRFAKAMQARVTGFIAEPDYRIPSENELYSGKVESLEAFDARTGAHAEWVLSRIRERAKIEGVVFDSEHVQNDDAAAAIAAAAQAHQCDLIVMASHGRRGLAKLLHGSVAEGVLTHTKIPVLVLH